MEKKKKKKETQPETLFLGGGVEIIIYELWYGNPLPSERNGFFGT